MNFVLKEKWKESLALNLVNNNVVHLVGAK